MFKGLRKKASVLLISSQLLQSSVADTNSTVSKDSSSYEKILKQVHDFEIALQAMDYLLDDRSEEGTDLLKIESEKHSSNNSDQPAAIFPLALGVMQFIEATLGFEPEVMAKAQTTLSEAEQASLNNSKYNIKNQLATSHIYPPGTEFQVTHAESTLLNALVMLLHENNGMVEGAKALFKLRKAYQTLDSVYKKIKELEPAFNKNLSKFKKQANQQNQNGKNISTVDLPGFDTSNNSSTTSLPQEIKLMKDLEKVYQMRKARVEGTSLEGISKQNQQNINLFKNNSASASAASLSRKPITSNSSDISNTNDNHLHVSTIDEFIHSGVQLCFGILQVVLSLIPPTIGKVLSIVGFRGDRITGLRMLWRTAITSRNIHGELALLCLLVLYDGPIQFVDFGFQTPDQYDSNVKSIIPIIDLSSITDSDLDKIMRNPALYTTQLLTKARKFFPHNALWILQEGRILASQGKLKDATHLMQSFTDDPNNKIQMLQVKSLLVFDRAMLYAFNQEFDSAAEDFLSLVKLSSWSQGVYLYLAGSCYLAQWRMIKLGLVEYDESERDNLLTMYAQKAERYIKEAPTYVPGHGHNASQKKGGIGGSNKQMPFDKFLLRKYKNIETNTKKYPELSFVECIGTSPIHELVYFWNGYNRMQPRDLEISYKVLGFTGAPNTEASLNSHEFDYSSIEETKDEAMVRYFLQAITLRQLGKWKEGLKLLDSHVISRYVTQDSPAGFKFSRLTYSPYLYPTALYEKSMFVWLFNSTAPDADIKNAIKESQAWMKKAEIVSDVGDYELSTRTSMRIKAAGDRLDQLSIERA
ncbi:mitochondrial outer membrane protein IML2 [Hyphopichia burtonii NRRL Y-1933]|uniref:Mitochondrial outer membrane protein IML2 n=1 Tax=Hyphopichia burtonii NRRL Y-1933 TaxID=984485 RepID=A0A1E4RPT2_9ASCO|nr:mitochondrial outer membrane protein IML2 [Hyphopichia burtonii NRRL Y-1933]ODV69283.1 mitochondrial outer membrane protein IML2 [Hyphopichia burtonii NRRL Y-1933]